MKFNIKLVRYHLMHNERDPPIRFTHRSGLPTGTKCRWEVNADPIYPVAEHRGPATRVALSGSEPLFFRTTVKSFLYRHVSNRSLFVSKKRYPEPREESPASR